MRGQITPVVAPREGLAWRGDAPQIDRIGGCGGAPRVCVDAVGREAPGGVGDRQGPCDRGILLGCHDVGPAGGAEEEVEGGGEQVDARAR